MLAFVLSRPLCSRPFVVCMSPQARLCFAHHVSRISRSTMLSCQQRVQARTCTHPSGRWQAMSCERLPYSSTGEVQQGAAHVRAHKVLLLLQCISRIAHATNTACLQFLGQPDLRRRRIEFLALGVSFFLHEFHGKFRVRILVVGTFWVLMEKTKNRFPNASQALFLSDLEGVRRS